MNEIMLCRALRKFVAEATKGVQMPDEKGVMRPLTVVDGYLDRSGEDPSPFVLIRPKSVSAEEEMTTGKVELIVVCRNEGKDHLGDITRPMSGYEDCLTIVHRIRRALMTLPNRVLDRRYVLSLPVSWTVHDADRFPYWQVDMTTSWEWHSPVITETLGEEVFG